MSILITDTTMIDGETPFEGRHRAIYSQLRLWQKFKSTIVIVLRLRSYTNMYLEELNIVKQPTDGKSVTANLKFVEVPKSTQTITELAANLLVSADVVHTATDLSPIGLI